MHVLDVGEAVGGGDQCGRAVLALDLAGDLGTEIALEGGNTAPVGDGADVGRLDAEHAVAAALEVRQQRAVVRADVDDEVERSELQHGRGFGIELGEIIPQQLGGAAGVGIFRRKDDDRIDREAELHQIALGAMEQVGGKPGLLPRHLADRDHLVHGRHIAERKYPGQRRMAADLTAFDRNACSASGGARDFCGKQHHLLPRPAYAAGAMLS